MCKEYCRSGCLVHCIRLCQPFAWHLKQPICRREGDAESGKRTVQTGHRKYGRTPLQNRICSGRVVGSFCAKMGGQQRLALPWLLHCPATNPMTVVLQRISASDKNRKIANKNQKNSQQLECIYLTNIDHPIKLTPSKNLSDLSADRQIGKNVC